MRFRFLLTSENVIVTLLPALQHKREGDGNIYLSYDSWDDEKTKRGTGQMLNGNLESLGDSDFSRSRIYQLRLENREKQGVETLAFFTSPLFLS